MILMYLFFAVISPTFLSYSRILSALNYAYFLGFLALGVTFAIATGGIDFSIGPVMFCAALIAGQLLTRSGVPVAVCLLVKLDSDPEEKEEDLLWSWEEEDGKEKP